MQNQSDFDSPFESDDVTVWMRENGSDKYYRVRIIPERMKNGELMFRPGCEYGPVRGTPLERDFSKPEWRKPTLEEARLVMIKILSEKIVKKNYTTDPRGNKENSLIDRAKIEQWKLLKTQRAREAKAAPAARRRSI